MAHGLSNPTDMIYASHQRKYVWHGLGVDIGEAISIEEMFQQYPQLAYEVVKVPTYYRVQVDDQLLWRQSANHSLIRKDSKKELGTCSSRYVVVQNQTALSQLVNPLISAKEGIIQTAGALYDGVKFFVSMKLPKEIILPGDDISEQYLSFYNTFDGSSGLGVGLWQNLIVCNNTFNMFLREGKNRVNIRHTKNAEEKLQEALQLMGLVNSISQEFEVLAQAMAQKKLSRAKAVAFIKEVFPISVQDISDEVVEEEQRLGETIEAARQRLIAQFKEEKLSRKAEQAIQLLETGTGMDLPSRKGTLWGAFNTVTETVDHFTNYKSLDARVDNALFNGAGAQQKSKAFGLARQLLKV